MDEMTFLKELARAERSLPAAGDVRAAVWERIGRECGADAADCVELEQAGKFGRWLWRMDLAAAVAVLVGGGVVYGIVRDTVADMYWSGSLFAYTTFF